MNASTIAALTVCAFLMIMAVTVMFLSFRNPFKRSLISALILTGLTLAITLPLSGVL